MPRRIALLALACLTAAAQEHVGQYSQADIDLGARLYAANCAICHGPNGDAVQKVDLRSGKFRNAVSDEDLRRLIATGVPGTPMPPHKFQNAELTAVVAYIRAMRSANGVAVALGDPARGKGIFAGKGACTNCHRVNGQGSHAAPDLSEIGAVRSPGDLQSALLDPTATMRPIDRPVHAVTRDGKTIDGRRLNEDTYSVQLIDSQERLVSLSKADLRQYTVGQTSTMPSYREKLSAAELADVLAYLLTLKGVN